MTDTLNNVDNSGKNKSLLSKKDINKSYLRWYLACEVSSSFERMQSLAFCYSMIPILKKLYKKKEELSKALSRHLNFFNTQGTWGTIVHGITIAMEEQKAKGEDIPDTAITGIKTGLMGPFAGIGDTLDWGTLKPIVFALAVSFGMTGSVAGAFIPFVFMVITMAVGYWLWNLGYSLGRDSVKSILEAGWIQELITGASILGLFMMGALSANFVKLDIPVVLNMAEGNELVIQEILDSIAPGILPLVVVFAIHWYLKNKGQDFGKIVLFLLAISLLGSFVGLF
jgi:D-glucosaminate-specific PTS system IID component